jgi:ATP:ADP antiporter, AAA family
MGRCSTQIGLAAFLMMFVGAGVTKTLGWQAGALITPAMMAVLSLPFFAALTHFGVSKTKPMLVAVYAGLVQNVLSKATKYSIFDPTKEMTYIPLDHNSKTKGKAAIDILGARMGKSGGAFIQQLLVVAFGSIITGAPVVAILFYGVIAAWIG